MKVADLVRWKPTNGERASVGIVVGGYDIPKGLWLVQWLPHTGQLLTHKDRVEVISESG